MTIQSQSSLYSTHVSRPRKRPTSAALLRAIKKVMKAELGATAIARWHDQLDEEIGEAVFGDVSSTPVAPTTTTSKVWCPAKPRLARLLMHAIVSTEPLADGKPVALAAPLTLGVANGPLAKIVSRRVVDVVIAKHSDELRACGELRASLFAENAEKQLAASIAHHATDMLTYVATRAKELAHADEHAILELQTVDQTLHGRETRGSGLVVCERGMALVQRAVDAILSTDEPVDAAEPSVVSSGSEEDAV